ncbi:hypothetical protein MPH_03406 [Macrophomina phaseolina MS6]|uniref:Uncharacterized protein n=1 Tax=Macrophomina phaseolina (strain MS6) TaxID=1126212 RepID=K2S3H5_MACPH|nr:hypothetical protein MPH_03406 [Macrophomina phaseolina MS6]
MRFTTATTALAFAGAASAAALQSRATNYQIVVDTSVCSDESNLKPRITGTGAYAGIDYAGPTWNDIWVFDVPADYQGHVWLYDTTQPIPTDAFSVYGLDFEIYNSPTDDKPNKATLKALGKDASGVKPEPLTSAAFASQVWGQITDSVQSYSGGSIGSTIAGDGLRIYYC